MPPRLDYRDAVEDRRPAVVLIFLAVASLVFNVGSSDADARSGAGPNWSSYGGNLTSHRIDGKEFIVLAVSGNDGAEILPSAVP